MPVATQAKQQEAKCGGEGPWAESTAHFLHQMGYREYGRYLSFHFPFTHERSLLEHLRAAPWNYDQRLFKARPSCARVWGSFLGFQGCGLGF